MEREESLTANGSLRFRNIARERASDARGERTRGEEPARLRAEGAHREVRAHSTTYVGDT